MKVSECDFFMRSTGIPKSTHTHASAYPEFDLTNTYRLLIMIKNNAL